MESDSNASVGNKEQCRVECAEFMDQLTQLLQQHHDRLMACFQPKPSVPVMAPPVESGLCRSSSMSKVASSGSEFSKNTSSASGSKKRSTGIGVGVAGLRSKQTVQAVLSEESRSRRYPSTFSQSEEVKRHASLKLDLDPALGAASKSCSSLASSLASLASLSVWRSAIYRMVTSSWFDTCMSFLIMSNALFCGVEAEYLARTRSQEPPLVFHYISCCYVALFLAEVALRIIAEGGRFFSGGSWAWNCFDLFIVIAALFGVIIRVESGDSLEVPSIRVVRMVRVGRVLRMARVLRGLRALRILVQCVASTLKSLLWTLLLLATILYFFAILFTEATTQHLMLPNVSHIPRLEEFFGTVGTSVLTLLMTVSGGVNWSEVIQPLMEVHAAWAAFFLVYFLFTNFAVLNVVTGIFCQNAMDSAHRDREMAAQAQLSAKQHYVSQLQALFKHINTRNTGVITLGEFEDSMQDEKMLAYFASIDLSIDEAFSLFKLLDREEAHVLDADTFVTGCLKLRGQATSLDVAMLMYETRWNMQKCLQCVKSTEAKVAYFQDFISASLGRASAVQTGVGDYVQNKLI